MLDIPATPALVFYGEIVLAPCALLLFNYDSLYFLFEVMLYFFVVREAPLAYTELFMADAKLSFLADIDMLLALLGLF